MHDHKRFIKKMTRGAGLCAVMICAVLLSGCFLVSPTTSGGRELSERYSEIEDKLNSLQVVIDNYYLYDDEIDVDEMVEGIYKGYVDALDEDYTVYYTAEEYADLMESTSGVYSGIGVMVSQDAVTGVITVLRPFEGAPGAEAGILKDDVIYKVGGVEVTGTDLDTVVSWIKGEEGTSVDIEVYRPSEDRYITFSVERRSVETPMTEYEMLENDIGYIAIYEFEETTYDQFDSAADDLTKQGMKGLIIDLRDNPGGLLNSATDVLDRILPPSNLLVYTKDKNDETVDEYYSGKNDRISVPIVVLINENTASASEIVSGCLQDYEAATIVGTTSFGKGIVQYIIPLSDGSAIKLTSARYYTPNGRNIHGTGIEPDVTVESDPDTETDEQLEKACEILAEQTGEE